MKIAIIAAIAQNRVIGSLGAIPWHLPADLRRFKALTTGHAIVMGRKTFASLGRPLPHRRNIVISSHLLNGVESYRTPDAALLDLAGEERVFIIGGGQLYASLLPQADELLLTIVDENPPGDTFFPPYEHLLGTKFRLVHSEDHPGFHFRDYVASAAVNQAVDQP